MRIGELAQQAGTTTRTLRYYESRGLLAARRGENGYRAYDEQDLHQVRQIRLLQDFGFELEDTRPFVECLRAGHPAGDSCPASLEVYRRKLAELDECLARLGEVREQVASQLARAELLAVTGEPRCELAATGAAPGAVAGAAPGAVTGAAPEAVTGAAPEAVSETETARETGDL